MLAAKSSTGSLASSTASASTITPSSHSSAAPQQQHHPLQPSSLHSSYSNLPKQQQQQQQHHHHHHHHHHQLSTEMASAKQHSMINTSNTKRSTHPHSHSTTRQHLLQIIHGSLQHHQYTNAEFFAERLQAHDLHLLRSSVSPTATTTGGAAMEDNGNHGSGLQRNCEESTFLLATSKFHQFDYQAAYHLLLNHQSSRCRYLLALCCMNTGRWSEGEYALNQICKSSNNGGGSIIVNNNNNNNISTTTTTTTTFSAPLSRQSVDPQQQQLLLLQPTEGAPSAADEPEYSIDMGSVYSLLGEFARRGNRLDQAKEFYMQAIRHNPFLFTAATQRLSELGVAVDVEECFREDNCQRWFDMQQQKQHFAINAGETASKTTRDLHANNIENAPATKPSQLLHQQPNSTHQQPLRTRSAVDQPRVTRRSATNTNNMVRQQQQSIPIALNNENNSTATGLRRSVRSVNTVTSGGAAAKSAREKKRTRNGDSKLSVADELSKMEIDYSTSREDLRGQPQQHEDLSVRFICGLLKIFTQSLNLLHSFQLSDCLRTLGKLPSHHQDTAWVQAIKARAFFEDHNYQAAERVYRRLGEMQPFRLDGMDLYSTTLWHLRKPVQLSHLAYRLLAFGVGGPSALSSPINAACSEDYESGGYNNHEWHHQHRQQQQRHLHHQTQLQTLSLKAIEESGGCQRPQLYIILGNAFNLQKDHENAIKCFQRAVDLDPEYAYGHTLLGHEYYANESLDKALACFRAALRYNARLYNAWYGLGVVYYKQEKWDMAEFHFHRALDLCPYSTILLTYMGMLMHKTHRYDDALQFYDRSIQMDQRNPHPYYRRALTLHELHRTTDALKCLKTVLDLAPDEFMVHLKIGTIYLEIGDKREALKWLFSAIDLDSRRVNMVKELIDRCAVGDRELIDEVYQTAIGGGSSS